MGPERLKQINGATKPVNTLNLIRFEAHNDPDAPVSKRQKKDSTRTYGQTTSPYFSKPRPPKNSDVQEAHVESSQDDLYDIISTSSAGNVGVTALALNEYRHVLPPSRRGARVRKSRTSSNSVSQPQSDAVDAKSNVHRFPTLQSSNRDRLSIDPDSPDVLAFEELRSTATDAGSDVSRHFNSKRDRPFRLAETTGPHIKRHKPSTAKEPIDVSEDELQADFAKYTEPNDSKSPPPITSDLLRRQKKATMRGDLHRTVFGKSLRQPQSDDIAVTRAVCGKWIYDRDSHSSAVVLRREGKGGKRLEPVSEDGRVADEHIWLGIDLEQVRSFGYSEGPSRYGYIMRSQSGDAGPKLYLEFESIDSTKDFLEILKSANIEERVIPDRRPGSALRKLKDSLIQAAKDLDDPIDAQLSEESLDFGLRRSTRSSAPATRRRMPSPDGWTESHPDWQKSWLAPLVFPPTGKNRATVDKIDIPRLDEREFLNDNLINFYIRYLEYKLEKERPELLRKVYFFSTFFFEKLKSTKGKINYDGVKAWTSKVDLLSYDYIFVPVNEHAHWYLAIICNVPNAIQSPASEDKNTKTSTASVPNAVEMTDAPGSSRMSTVERDLTDISLEDVAATSRKEVNDLSSSHGTASLSIPPSPTRKRKSAGTTPSKFDPTQPRIITLDSLGGPHAPTCKALKEYLVEEARTKKGITLTTIPTGMTARGIPEQNNFCDCGVFVLGYMQEFLTNPDEAARKLLLKEELGWNIRPSELRNHMRGLLFDLQVEQQKQHQQLQEEKKLRKAKRKSMAEKSSPQIPSSPKPIASSSPAPKLPGAFPSESPERKPMSGAELSSSESVQEADKLKDNNLNGDTLHEDEQRFRALAEPQFISCLSDASTTSPNITKAKIPPIPSSKAPEELQFVSCLSDGGSISPNIAQGKIPPIDSCLTSKYNGYSSKLVVELKSFNGHDKSQFEEAALVDDEADVQFVKQVSSSSSENEARLKSTETRRSRQSSVELIEATESRPTSSRKHNQSTESSTSVSPRFRVRRSIESDVHHGTREGPKYDGIDRSADRTIS
ncbi:hypothetical protein ACHAQJ_006872 [Trichoderma viride]